MLRVSNSMRKLKLCGDLFGKNCGFLCGFIPLIEEDTCGLNLRNPRRDLKSVSLHLRQLFDNEAHRKLKEVEVLVERYQHGVQHLGEVIQNL